MNTLGIQTKSVSVKATEATLILGMTANKLWYSEPEEGYTVPADMLSYGRRDRWICSGSPVSPFSLCPPAKLLSYNENKLGQLYLDSDRKS